MKELDLTIDNLIFLWEVDDMKGDNFTNWLKTNEDILIDFDNEIIYTGLTNFFNDIDTYIELEKHDLFAKGLTKEEIVLRSQSSYDAAKERLNGLFLCIPIEKRSGLFLEMILKIRDKFYQHRSAYLDKKVDLLLGLNPKIDKLTSPQNPYPKIFKDYKSYNIFKYLLDEFGNTNENLANYSFVFRKMTYEGLIHSDLKQQSYISFLNGFDISIERIKSLRDIGKIPLRESIYAKSKWAT
ncbi:MAG: hypothetical protein V4652_00750 [Bacteroidota bacterium]